MNVKQHVALPELERLERAEKNAAHAKRLRIVILAYLGYTAPAIAMSLGLSRRICQRWLYRRNTKEPPAVPVGTRNRPGAAV